jgi:hypothetical protein
MVFSALAMLGSNLCGTFRSIEDDQSMVNLHPRLLALS